MCAARSAPPAPTRLFFRTMTSISSTPASTMNEAAASTGSICARRRDAAVKQVQAREHHDRTRVMREELHLRQRRRRLPQPEPVNDGVNDRNDEADQKDVRVRYVLSMVLRRRHHHAENHAERCVDQREDQVLSDRKPWKRSVRSE